MLTRRDILRQAGMAATLAATAPWWLVRRAHAARQEKLVVWNPPALAPQVDKIMKEQCYEYLKQAGIKESEIDYSVISSREALTKLAATLEAGNPPDLYRTTSGYAPYYRAQGHLLDVTDIVDNMRQVPDGLFPISLMNVMHEGRAFAVPQSVSPWPLITRMDVLETAKVEPPKTWDEFIEVSKKLQKPPRLTAFGICLGMFSDASNNLMNMIWGWGGKLVEADNKTVAFNSPGTIAAVKAIAEMYQTHKIIPKGTISWDNTGNNKAYQSRQVIFVLNPTSIFAHLARSDKELYDVTGLLPIPSGPAGAFEELSTQEWLLFRHNPYPEIAKGLVQYWMDPKNLRIVIEEGDGRWGPPYKQMYDSDFWKRPAFVHWRQMLDRGRTFASPGILGSAAGEVIALNVLPRMMQRVLVESWEPEKAVVEAHNAIVEIYARHVEG